MILDRTAIVDTWDANNGRTVELVVGQEYPDIRAVFERANRHAVDVANTEIARQVNANAKDEMREKQAPDTTTTTATPTSKE